MYSGNTAIYRCALAVPRCWLCSRATCKLSLHPRCTGLYTVSWCTTLHYTTLHYTALHCTTLHCTTLLHYCTTALHCTTLHCTALTQGALFALYCTAMCCTSLYFCISLYCTVLHCTVLGGVGWCRMWGRDSHYCSACCVTGFI